MIGCPDCREWLRQAVVFVSGGYGMRIECGCPPPEFRFYLSLDPMPVELVITVRKQT